MDCGAIARSINMERVFLVGTSVGAAIRPDLTDAIVTFGLTAVGVLGIILRDNI